MTGSMDIYMQGNRGQTGEGGGNTDNNVISGIPGGMGASMATADQRLKKNK